MAADKQPEKTVNIQSSVNVGTATGETAVSGAKVSVGGLRRRSTSRALPPHHDYCAERIFLRKVGGGYIFVHRLLMEHFAGLERGVAE